MKRFIRLISFIAALCMATSLFPVSVSALKLQMYDYKFPNGEFTRDVENGAEPTAAGYFDSTVRYSGNYSLKLVSEPGPNSKKEFRVYVGLAKLEKNKNYKISFMLRGANMNALSLTVTNQSNWWQLGNVFGKNFDWTPVELEFNYPSENPHASAAFIVWGECDGIWIDDLKLYKENGSGVYSEVEGAIENGDFEQTGTTEIIKESQETESEDSEKFTVLSESDAIIVQKAEKITLDGDVSEWDEYKSHPITDWVQLVESEQTLEADIKYAYDEDAFYYMVQVEDETHKYVEGSRYWSGDSLQAALDNNASNNFGVPVGSYFDEEKNKIVFISDTAGTEMATTGENAVSGAAKRTGTTTTYEVRVPWTLIGDSRPDKIKFSLIVNDNDTGVRKGFLQVAEGVSSPKISTKFPYLYFGENGGGISSVKMKESQIQLNEKFKCELSYSNVRSRAVDVKIKYDDEVKTVKIDPMTKYINMIELDDFDDIGAYKKIITIDDGEHANDITVTGTVVPDDEFVKKFQETVNSWAAELDLMRDECTEKGLPTPYEKADIRLLKRFAETTIPFELERGEYARVAHFYDVLPQIYEECRDSLKAILSGEKEAVDVPKYVTSDLEIRDGAYWGTVEKDGVQYESPITFNGVCSFTAPSYYIDDFKEYGMNESEIGVYSYMMIEWNGSEFVTVPEEERKGRRIDEYAWENVIKQLEECEKNGISVSLIVSPMAWPHMDEYGYSDYKDSTNHVYNPMNVNHPMVAVVADAVYKEIGKLCDKYECIDNICLSNEPTVKLAGNSYYDGQWAEFLSKRYNGDIEWLNRVYGDDANYKDFSEIKMPDKIMYGVPVYHDYRMFCEDVYHQYIEIVSAAARKYTNLPLCVKEMQRSRDYNSDYTLNFATTLEKNKDLLDLAGCDAFYVPSSGGLGLDTKMMWYDYITSVMEAPVQNGEDHIGSDGQGGVENKYYDDLSYKASTWQGMIHGGGGQSIWMYSDFEKNVKQGNGVEFEPQVNLMQLPKSLRDSYRNNMDALRLANEVNALYTAPRNLGILWANTSWGYNAKFMNGLFKTYENAIYNGQRVKFVTEYTLEQLDKIKLLVIPGTTHILPETLSAIKNYVDRGGRLVVIGKDCLSFDDYNQPNNGETVDYILSKATIIDSDILATGGTLELPENYDEIMTKEYENAGLMNVVLKDAETGEKVEGVEWISNKLNGKTVINPFNYDRENKKTVEIWIDGEKVDNFKDLKGGKTYNGTITLEPQEPYLIEIGGNAEGEFDDILHVGWANEAISKLCRENVINGVADRLFAPDKNVTREQIAKMIVKATKTDVKNSDVTFADVDDSEWYAPFVKTAYESEFAKGISAAEFGIGDAITRQDLAVMVYRAAKKIGKIAENADLNADFKDAGNVSDYAKEAVAALKTKGIINGDENGNFNPNDSCTRAEAAKIIYNTFLK